MTLETLAKDIEAAAQKEAAEILSAAKVEAKGILSEAEAKASTIRDEATARAEKDANQLSKEIIASARQSNQKDILIARRKALDATFTAAKAEIGNAGLKGRDKLLKSLLDQATKAAGKDFVIRPVELDRAAITKAASGQTIGDSIDGLGGFMIEANDGSVSFDYRFDSLLNKAWNDQLSAVNSTLFD